jgi:hypothetical protein
METRGVANRAKTSDETSEDADHGDFMRLVDADWLHRTPKWSMLSEPWNTAKQEAETI